MNLWHLADERHYVAEELHEASYAHVLTGAYAEHGEYGACNEALSDAFSQLVLGEGLFLEEFLHKTLVVFGGSLYERLVQFHCLVHFLGRYIFDDRSTAFRLPRVFLHEEHVDERVESCSSGDRVLYLYAFRTIDVLHGRDKRVEVALVAVELVDKEYHRLLQLFSVSEVVLRAYLGTVLSVDEDHGLVSHVESRNGTSDEIVRSRTVDDVQLLVVPFNVEHGREDRVAVFLLYREVVADCVFSFDGAAALDDAGFIKHRLGKCCLAATRTAKQCNVFDFTCLIYFHI